MEDYKKYFIRILKVLHVLLWLVCARVAFQMLAYLLNGF